ncbi:PAS domain-containing sensor histidine kinase [Rhodobacteraceae bacterium RKSG542]|uniref:sensor histidine kinase NtrY-like n=1 Tax=Pseudovibrio flavus TaxID=2529854 RepID=UPI0012BBA28E|nr:PAS domain-containing sensor histidine kinase [Pseudovibrio flavus]MTI16102.1 PAS domain-containing sensor histidine kinase [Pseudovibrio flavus]
MILKTKLDGDANGNGLNGRKARIFGLSIVVVALISIALSFLVLMGLTPIDPTENVIYAALITNSLLVATLVGLIIWEFSRLLKARRRGRAAARLHVRTVTMFSLVAAIPAIIVAAVATITLDQGLDRWFEKRTKEIIGNAQSVAAAYVQEHGNILRSTLIAMVNDVDLNRNAYHYEPSRFDRFFETQTWVRGLLGAYILKRDGTVVMRVLRDPDVAPLLPPENAMKQAQDGAPILIHPGVSNLVGGVMKLSAYDDLYLYVTRALDPRVVEYQRLAEAGVNDYAEMENGRFGVQLAFAIVYVGVALVLLLASIWVGFGFANNLVRPIRNLIGAADEVSKGNLKVQVEANGSSGDMVNLASTFNNMTGQLRGQREALLAANDQIDKRRRFTEAVLSGVSSGVIGIDDAGRITLVNRAAMDLLKQDEKELLAKPIGEAIKELSETIDTALEQVETNKPKLSQVSLVRRGRERTVNVQVTTEEATRTEHGFVVTLDDITDLVAAQRNSAWADVARRIAHEIKNPLTPIQLSAERIRRRYAKQIVDDDRKVFDQCVDTIIRQVGDIGRMVDEFSSFARMPKPHFSEGDLRNTVREAAFMLSVANPDIKIESELPDEVVPIRFDSRLVGQAVGNVVKNATEAVGAYQLKHPDEEKGHVLIRLVSEGDMQVVEVIDNGIGLPAEHRQRLLEPYMTTREKGTGLGLAIVRKIMEDHGGGIELCDAPSVAQGGHGAMIRLFMRTSTSQDKNEISTEEMVGAGNGNGHSDR